MMRTREREREHIVDVTPSYVCRGLWANGMQVSGGDGGSLPARRAPRSVDRNQHFYGSISLTCYGAPWHLDSSALFTHASYAFAARKRPSNARTHARSRHEFLRETFTFRYLSIDDRLRRNIPRICSFSASNFWPIQISALQINFFRVKTHDTRHQIHLSITQYGFLDPNFLLFFARFLNRQKRKINELILIPSIAIVTISFILIFEGLAQLYFYIYLIKHN